MLEGISLPYYPWGLLYYCLRQQRGYRKTEGKGDSGWSDRKQVALFTLMQLSVKFLLLLNSNRHPKQLRVDVFMLLHISVFYVTLTRGPEGKPKVCGVGKVGTQRLWVSFILVNHISQSSYRERLQGKAFPVGIKKQKQKKTTSCKCQDIGQHICIVVGLCNTGVTS